MTEQNYKNHRRYVPAYHGITALLILAGLIGSIINFLRVPDENIYSASLLLIVFIVLCSLFWFARRFALQAQDRAIRAEESLRHFILTGKPFDKQLRLGQIIALRFAADEEMPALAKRAVEEKLTQTQIKQAIQSWRVDYYRV